MKHHGIKLYFLSPQDVFERLEMCAAQGLTSPLSELCSITLQCINILSAAPLLLQHQYRGRRGSEVHRAAQSLVNGVPSIHRNEWVRQFFQYQLLAITEADHQYVELAYCTFAYKNNNIRCQVLTIRMIKTLQHLIKC